MSVTSILKLFCSWNTLFFPFLLVAFSLLVSGSSKNSDPIIIILGPPGLSLPIFSETQAQIESPLYNRNSSSSISSSSFSLFRSSSTNKKDKDRPHMIFIAGSAAIPMNTSNNYTSNKKSGQIVGSPNLGAILSGGSTVGAVLTGGSEINSVNTNGFVQNNTKNLPTGPMRRNSNGPG
uniref:Uncharacterized protein n=1 Tax=Tetranychus urticae TaxID=32264 RepID=T1JWK4_TETUR